MSKILTYPNKILRKRAEEVKELDKKALKDIDSLIKKLKATENGIGLAAPQIGISRRFFGVKGGDGEVRVFINPKIVKVVGDRGYLKIKGEDGKEEDFLEGCLSFPGLFGTVKRWLKIKIKWQEIIKGKLTNKKDILEGFKAIVWQHESDHLDGKLFMDYVKEEKGRLCEGSRDVMVDIDINSISI
jgi:peptide deformylase